MKKLMTAFAACMMAGLVSAEIASQNIVGYQTMAGNVGFTVVAPTFVSVGGTDQFTFGQIQGSFEIMDTLQFFSAAGDVNFQAVWLTEDAGAPAPGWYNFDDWGISLTDEPVPAGTAFFASMASGGDITVSGQVSSQPVTVTSVEGFTVIGNCRPYPIQYGDLVCTDLSIMDTLQFFSDTGDVNFQAVWLTEDAGAPAPGWYNFDDWGISLATETIAAGQGFFLSCAAAGATVTIPAPTL